jgi:rhodanese-related sulfurtransferase
MKTAHDLVVQAKQAVQEISVDEAVAAIQACDVLIDVREADEFAAGHLPSAMHMSRGMLEFKMAGNPKSKRET